ncbi:MAG: complex I subunit 4 family protein [Planctomycetota bacterium]|jgi:NADH-quinone oxidoreductase subunit M
MIGLPILTLIVFTPLLGALLLAFVNRKNESVMRQGALVVSLVTLLLSLVMLVAFEPQNPGYQFEENNSWSETLGIRYHLGLDGISVLLVLLTTFSMPLVLLSTWRAVTDRVKEYQIALLVLQAGMLGAFVALDLILFYLFWEAMLIPMYFIVGIWGGKQRIKAAWTFFIYTMVGSLLMFVAILYIRSHTGTFDLPEVLRQLRSDPIDEGIQRWLFAAFALSFAIKVPIFPLHSWLPLAHVQAPTAGSVVLAGVLLKMGTYGFIRFGIPLFPGAAVWATPFICWLAVIGIIYGALLAWRQSDIKKLVAYSSVSHLGYVVLGIFLFRTSGESSQLISEGMIGAIIQMVNHGLSTGMLFLLIGIIYERRHTREIDNFGGIAKVMPVYSTFFIIATLSSIGLPGLNGFVGEFLILKGSFTANPLFGALAATGVILGAVYMLMLCRRFLFGPVIHQENAQLPDVSTREVIYLVPLVVMMVWIGLFSKSFTDLISPTVHHYLQNLL